MNVNKRKVGDLDSCLPIYCEVYVVLNLLLFHEVQPIFKNFVEFVCCLTGVPKIKEHTKVLKDKFTTSILPHKSDKKFSKALFFLTSKDNKRRSKKQLLAEHLKQCTLMREMLEFILTIMNNKGTYYKDLADKLNKDLLGKNSA